MAQCHAPNPRAITSTRYSMTLNASCHAPALHSCYVIKCSPSRSHGEAPLSCAFDARRRFKAAAAPPYTRQGAILLWSQPFPCGLWESLLGKEMVCFTVP